MKTLKTNLSILGLLLFSAIVRLFSLGKVPAGLSITEVNYGLWLSKGLGKWVLSPLIVRLPFALVGIISVYLFYLIINKFGSSEKLALLSAFLLSTAPWHTQESRILSWWIIISFILLLLIVLFSEYFRKYISSITRWMFLIAVGVFVVSLFFNTSELAEKVNVDRNISYQNAGAVSKVFSNKLIESYRSHLGNVLEGMDPGYYFFSGHPRERWGVEESQKMFIVFLPLIILGLFRLKKRTGLLILGIFAIALSVNSAFMLQSSSSYFPVVFIFCYLAALGILSLVKRNLIVLYIFIAVFSYEYVLFGINYVNGYSESLFSPRRFYYQSLVEKIDQMRKPGELVLVTDKFVNPRQYFRFYLMDRDLAGYEFRNYIVWDEENLDKLFVDIQPQEELPSTPLGNSNSDQLDILYKRNVTKLGGDVLIYRYGK